MLVFLTLVLSISSMCAVILTWNSPASWFIVISFVMALSILFLIIMSYMRKRRTLAMKLSDVQVGQDALTNRMSALHKKVDKLTDYAGSNLRLARQLPNLADKIQTLDSTALQDSWRAPTSTNVQGYSQKQARTPESYFAPSFVKAKPIESKPNAHLPGRLAAAQLTHDPDENIYGVLLNESQSTSERHVGIIGSWKTQRALEATSKPHMVHPHFGKEQIGVETSYLIIDEQEISNSTWTGVLNAQSTGTLRELLTILNNARKLHVTIVVITSNKVDHNSMLIRSKADVTVDSDGTVEDLPWGSDLQLPVLDACVKYVRGA